MVLRRNGTVPSTVMVHEIDSKIFLKRELFPAANTEDGFMICICELNPSMPLSIVSVSWKGFYGQNLKDSKEYEEVTWRNETTHVIGTRLALRHRSKFDNDGITFECSSRCQPVVERELIFGFFLAVFNDFLL